MSDAPTMSAPRSAAIGPGRLVLVVGPSGAGKDTLLGLAKAACAGQRGIVFPRRVVTRQASSAEDNAQLSFADFRGAIGRGDFAVHWEAHGHCYAPPRAIDDDVRARRTVVANVSRTVVEAMRRAYADITVVAVTAPSEILAARLAARARSSDGGLAERLRRPVDGVAAAPDITINNIGSAEHHARELVRVITGG
jgi:ribose 1,5-bisphosphokinase